MEKKKNDLLVFFKSCGKKTKTVFSIVLVCLIAALLGVVIFAPSGETKVSVKTSLQEILEVSEMSTSEYTYNSIAKIPLNPDQPVEEDNIKYQVAYKGSVKSGFDFEDVGIEEKKDSIIVIVPKIDILSVSVEPDLEYIFTKQKYDTEKTYAEAYTACCKDLEEKAEANRTLYNTAIESAVETITALTKPFEKHLGEKTIQVVYVDDYSLEVE